MLAQPERLLTASAAQVRDVTNNFFMERLLGILGIETKAALERL
jgi:hypothetical protein